MINDPPPSAGAKDLAPPQAPSGSSSTPPTYPPVSPLTKTGPTLGKVTEDGNMSTPKPSIKTTAPKKAAHAADRHVDRILRPQEGAGVIHSEYRARELRADRLDPRSRKDNRVTPPDAYALSASLADHLSCTQFFELVIGEAEAPQDLLVVLSECRRRESVVPAGAGRDVNGQPG